jgi:antitoxin PrlF
MPIAKSKITAQGQISVPAEVRRKLGVQPGSVLEWDEAGGQIVVRKVGKYTFEDIHNALFRGKKPKKRSLEELRAGIEQHIREQYARGRY